MSYLLELKARLKDQLNLASKLTLSKVFNSAKLLASYYWSRITKKPVQWGYPASISFEPTTSCNLRCPECPSGLRAFTRPTGMLKNQFFNDSILQLKKELHYLTFYFQGEPYLNPKFLDMVKFAHDNKIYTATSTNGHYLKDEMAKKTIESGLDRLIISITGLESFEDVQAVELELDKIFAIKSRDFHFFDRANIEYQAQLFQTTDALLKELRGSTKLYVKELAQDSATIYLEYLN